MAEPITEKSEKGMDKMRDSVRRIDQQLPEPGTEGKMTKMVEHQTSRVPSIAYLGLAVASMVASAGYEFFSDRRKGVFSGKSQNLGTFIGLWAPTFLLLGIYNKIVKLEGSDQKNKDLSSSPSRYY